MTWDRPGNDVLDEDLRLLAIPVSRPGGMHVVVVGSSLDERNEPLTALLVAEVVALAVANADAHAPLGEQARNMRLAMESRAVIEQAKGVLMAQRQVDADQAFEILREASQRYNRKLRDIAVGIVEGTQQPGR